MKTKLFTTLVALFVTVGGAKAMAADEMVDLIKCHPVTEKPDLGMSVTLSVGGFAGLTVIKVEHFFLGRSSEKAYIVRQALSEPQQNGQPVVFLGEDVSFEADFNKASTDGGAPAVLKLREGTNDFSVDELSCSVVQQIPEVNFAY